MNAREPFEMTDLPEDEPDLPEPDDDEVVVASRPIYTSETPRLEVPAGERTIANLIGRSIT